MIIDIDQRSDIPIYEQLHRQIIAGIANDELTPGDQLPSVRALAVDLGINLHTVNKAYALLRDEGYIVMRRGTGASVADRRATDTTDGADTATTRTTDEQTKRMNDDLHRLALAHKARGGSLDAFLDAARRQAERVYTSSSERDIRQGE
ncbi:MULTISPECIES: GntR family transcriptional regulator [Bifidobacterium]|uniref:GntR family transcriptional regulator n=1 Tax=Bifidobacterium TaxID=1678 RepID=UPI001BDD24C8|nr:MULTISPECIES: GntR family transcriptional regulator [Bifidobacterium]MBT1160871.1 GntR family transcriptional regulator [Bifidobacterium sp. SO1]MBW3077666.1 GntR family transcriptional regulator [Bifidobacterium simiiventris]